MSGWIILLGAVLYFLWYLFIKPNDQSENDPSKPFRGGIRSPYMEDSRALRELDEADRALKHEIVEASGHLAGAAVRCANNFTKATSVRYLNHNNFTIADTAIFASFLARISSIPPHANTYYVAYLDDYYSSAVKDLLISTGFECSELKEMIDNRISLYKSVFQQFGVSSQGFNAALEEFEYVIKEDIVENEYKPFFRDSPLTILGFADDIQLAAEVAQFFDLYKSRIPPYVKQVYNLFL